MRSLLPDLLNYSQLAPTMLRVVIAIIFIHWAYRCFKSSPTRSEHNVILGMAYGILGVLFLAGIFTQFAALVSVIILGVLLVRKAIGRALLTDGINYYLLVFAIALSLLFTGAGFVAFDVSF